MRDGAGINAGGINAGRGVARCLAAAVLFGASAPAASTLAGGVPAFTLAGLLYLGAGMAVAPSVVRHPPTRRALAGEWRPVAVAVVVGGALGPVLLMAGLARTEAASASILLNTELAATVVLARLFFREHLGPRVVASAVLVTVAGAMLAWQPGASPDIGALLVVAACLCWGLDNCVTARIQLLGPEHVVALKGIVAGAANLAVGLVLAGPGTTTTAPEVAAALAIGAVGFGASITLWVKGAQELGAARGQVIFSAAPFVGAGLAWTLLAEPTSGVQLVAMVVAAAGVAISFRSSHEHPHFHQPVAHVHGHSHRDGHHEDHDDGHAPGDGHPHRHPDATHVHPHVPDLHHRHHH